MDNEKKNRQPNYKLLVERATFLNEIVRYWFHHLSLLERSAVIFIYDRTCAWGKEWNMITTEHFTKGVIRYVDEETSGVTGGDVEVYAAPITTDRSGASKVIQNLLTRGVIKRRPWSGGKGIFEYSLNADWEVPPIELPDKFRMGNMRAYRRDQAKARIREAKLERKREQRRMQKKKARIRKKKQS